MKRVLLCLFGAVLLLLPAKTKAQDMVMEDSIKSEVEEVWPAGTKSTFKVLSKIGKINVMTPKVENPEPKATAADKEMGFIPFERSYLIMTYYNYNPTEAERKIEALKAFASPGEFEPLTICLHPLEDARISVSVSDLSGKTGKIPKENIEIGAVRHMLKIYAMDLYEVRPEMIKPGNSTDLKKGVNRTIWLTLHVPEGTAEGIYEGDLTIKGAKKAFTAKISFEVLPIKLLTNQDYSIGWYGMPTDDVNMKDAIEHGCNAVDTGLAPTMKYNNGNISLDFSDCNKRVEQLKKLGLTPYIHQINNLGYANEFINGQKLAEFSPEFNKAYKDVNTQLVKYYTDNKLKVAFWLVDEPREDVLNSWNRHYAETVKYIKLAKEIPGMIALVDPMGDKNGAVDYTALTDMLDVLATHSYDGSIKMMTKIKNGAKARLWLYNSGRTRISFGFNPWKWKAGGRWEWAYAWGWDEAVSKDFKSWSTYQAGDPACGIVFPTAQGPLSTPSYEMCREGVDDYRYIYTLEQKILEAGKSAKPEAAAAAKKARAVLDQMNTQTPDFPITQAGAQEDKYEKVLDGWRYKVAQEIISLDKILK